VLNFGHTFGHAIEAGLGFGTWLHGEAVASGMVLASALSARLGLTDQEVGARLSALLSRCGLPTRAPALDTERYLELMRLDKKAKNGEIRFTLLHGRGQATVHAIPDDVVREIIEQPARSA